jgi:starch synthase
MSLQVLSVTPEAFPLIKTGGLGDVAGALPVALAAEGVRMRTLIPAYPAVRRAAAVADGRVLDLPTGVIDQVGGPGKLLAFTAHGVEWLAVDIPHLFDRPGSIYLGGDGRDWPDNPQRFAALSRTGAEIGLQGVLGWRPDIVHCHDWQSGLTAAYLHYAGAQRPGTVFTVHNLAFPGKVPLAMRVPLRLPPEAATMDGLEFYNTLSLLKAGLQYADRVTTVSPTYAAEICGVENGMGFDGLLRARGSALSGVLNGIDTEAWDPAVDASLAGRFDAATLARRAANKAALRARMGLADDPAALVFGVVSRLTWQKGIDLLLQALPELLAMGAQLAMLGTGDRPLEDAFRAAAVANAGRVGVVVGYDEALAHLIQGGVDALLVPSRFEPCGLTQLCALRYGAVPVVARVGGLADTVIDANPAAIGVGVATGVQFSPITAEALRQAIRRTGALYAQPEIWTKIQANGMAQDVSWRGPARQYLALYRGLKGQK